MMDITFLEEGGRMHLLVPCNTLSKGKRLAQMPASVWVCIATDSPKDAWACMCRNCMWKIFKTPYMRIEMRPQREDRTYEVLQQQIGMGSSAIDAAQDIGPVYWRKEDLDGDDDDLSTGFVEAW